MHKSTAMKVDDSTMLSPRTSSLTKKTRSVLLSIWDKNWPGHCVNLGQINRFFGGGESSSQKWNQVSVAIWVINLNFSAILGQIPKITSVQESRKELFLTKLRERFNLRTLTWCKLITGRNRRLGQGNVFTSICHSVHGLGGVVHLGGLHTGAWEF